MGWRAGVREGGRELLIESRSGCSNSYQAFIMPEGTTFAVVDIGKIERIVLEAVLE